MCDVAKLLRLEFDVEKSGSPLRFADRPDF
jgi:hypothetical protein